MFTDAILFMYHLFIDARKLVIITTKLVLIRLLKIPGTNKVNDIEPILNGNSYIGYQSNLLKEMLIMYWINEH